MFYVSAAVREPDKTSGIGPEKARHDARLGASGNTHYSEDDVMAQMPTVAMTDKTSEIDRAQKSVDVMQALRARGKTHYSEEKLCPRT